MSTADSPKQQQQDADDAVRRKEFDDLLKLDELLKEEDAKASALAAKKSAEPVPAAAAATATTSASSSPKVKPPKPPLSLHDNGHDAVFTSPAFGVHWVTPQHVVIGGGGGGKKYELPNLLTLLHVPSASWTGGSKINIQTQFDNEDDDDPMLPRGPLFTTEQSLDFEEAGTIQAIAGDATALVSCEPFAVDARAAASSSWQQQQQQQQHEYHFVVTHTDSFSLVRATSTLVTSKLPGCLDKASAQVTRCSLKAVCRVAIIRDLIDSDTKLAAVAGGFIFVAQDNSTVAVFRLSTLTQWAQRESALQREGPIVAATTDAVRANALAVCDFACGGRVCDMKALKLTCDDPKKKQQQKKAATTTSAANISGAADESAGGCSTVMLALCGRDKVLRVGTFDAVAREFVPLRMLGVADFGFDPKITNFSAKSVRACDFSAAIRNTYDPTAHGVWTGTAADLFVALHPQFDRLHAARLLVTATPSATAAGAPPKVVVSVADLCASSEGCKEAPSSAMLMPGMSTGDKFAPEHNFVVATVEGSFVEFVFHGCGGAGSIRPVSSAMRRYVKNVHGDAVTSLALSPVSETVVAGTLKETRICVSTDISKRVAFHTYDPRSKTNAVLKTPGGDKIDVKSVSLVAPDLFAEAAECDKPLSVLKLRRTLMLLAMVSFAGMFMSWIVAVVLSYF